MGSSKHKFSVVQPKAIQQHPSSEQIAQAVKRLGLRGSVSHQVMGEDVQSIYVLSKAIAHFYKTHYKKEMSKKYFEILYEKLLDRAVSSGVFIKYTEDHWLTTDSGQQYIEKTGHSETPFIRVATVDILLVELSKLKGEGSLIIKRSLEAWRAAPNLKSPIVVVTSKVDTYNSLAEDITYRILKDASLSTEKALLEATLKHSATLKALETYTKVLLTANTTNL